MHQGLDYASKEEWETPEPKKKFGEIILDYKFITGDQLAQGIDQQKITRKRLEEILTELGFVTEEKLTQAPWKIGKGTDGDGISR